MASAFPRAYMWFTYEDLAGEWAQFFFFLTATILSFRTARLPSPYRRFFVLLGIACLYASLEEISWGQRLFDIPSPWFFRAYNLQGETNLHNFFTGPFHLPVKQALRHFLALLLLLYGLVFPLATGRGLRAAVRLDGLGVASPPIYLWPFFAAAAFLELGLLRFNEAEVAELLIGSALAMTAAHYRFSLRRGLPTHRTASWPDGQSGELARSFGLMWGVVVALAAAVTLLINLSPVHREGIENRVRNGMEKFAPRYGRGGRWDVAADFYERLHDAYPSDTSITRKLAGSYRRLGDEGSFERYAREALAVDLEFVRSDPLLPSDVRFLAESYRLLGRAEEAERSLRQALEIDIERLRAEPSSAEAVHSLGLTYKLLGESEKALRQFERARALERDNWEYRKDLLKARSD